jgi:D-inositol-3-phosphate glycosyltransferase
MKVAIFVTYTFPYIGSGIGNVALNQGEKLAEFGHEVTIVSSNFPKTKKEFIKNKVKYIKIPALYFLEKINVPVPLYLYGPKVIKLIKSSDIIHIHDAVYPSSFFAALIAKLFKKPVVLSQHVPLIVYPNAVTNIIQKLAYKTLGNSVFNMSNKIICYNPEIKKMINRDKKICWIPNGVDVSLFSPAGGKSKSILREKYKLVSDKKIVLFVGRLVPKKGFKILFEARDSRYLILFVANGEIPEYMKESEDVVFIPSVKYDELNNMYKLSDIFILPSHGEGFPLSIQEAMSTGLPVITSKSNIFDSDIDFIKKIDLNVESIRNAILELVSDDRSLVKMGEESRHYATENYDWYKNVRILEGIYKSL